MYKKPYLLRLFAYIKYNLRKKIFMNEKMNKILKAIFVIFAVWFSFLLWIVYQNKNIQITKYDITNSKIPKSFDKFRIVQISDYHNGTFTRNNEKLIQKLSNCNPDIIVITGDLFDGKDEDFSLCFDLTERLIKLAPVYFVTGNHEKSIKEYQDLKQHLEEIGVTVLEDEITPIERNGESISLLGIQDLNFQKKMKNIQNVIQGLMKENTYNILLSHRPEIFEDYVSSNVDLVFTGHTHGGQFRIPFIGGIYAPHQGFFPKYDAGLFVKNNTTMIINRGLGQSSIPLRFNNNPEIVLVELHSK